MIPKLAPDGPCSHRNLESRASTVHDSLSILPSKFSPGWPVKLCLLCYMAFSAPGSSLSPKIVSNCPEATGLYINDLMLVTDFCLSLSPVAVIIHSDNGNLREKEFI